MTGERPIRAYPAAHVHVDLLATPERAQEIRRGIPFWRSLDLAPAQLADLELLVSGALRPLTGFLTSADCAAVMRTGRLEDGTFWPAPVLLPIPAVLAGDVARDQPLVLRDAEGVPVAVVHPV
jgi:sulfate adenylyltransferase